MRKYLYYILCLITSVSCQSKLDETNKFDMVIAHYSQNEKDSLKLKAAHFLIDNLKGQQVLDTNSVQSNQVYFDLVEETWKHEKMRVGFRMPVQTRVIDSLNKADNLPQKPPHAVYIDDAKIVTYDFLIQNIDNAFYAWNTMPWSKNVNFNDFCEYILPYRSSITYSFNAREHFLKRYKFLQDSVKGSGNSFIASNFIIKDIDIWFNENPTLISRYPYLYPIKFSNLLTARFGDCLDGHSVRIAALRALGIPSAMEEVPNWGNSNQKHNWYKIIDPQNDTVKALISNRNILTSTQYIISSSSYDEPNYYELPPKVEVTYVRTIPKVYRRSFTKQSTSLAAIKAPDDEIPAYFEDSRLKDVTRNYLETTSVNIKLNGKEINDKFVYLCVFDNQEWRPVCWARNVNRSATFKDIGKNIVYLAAYYRLGEIIPASDPFILSDQGKMTPIKPLFDTKESVTLFAKFPTRPYVLANSHAMVGGRFQFANKADLSDTVTAYTVKHTPFNETEIKVTNGKKYRFLIFQFKNIPLAQLSEITFFGLDANGKEIKLNGKLIGNKGYYPYKLQNVFDGDRASYFKTLKDDSTSYVGLDLGQGGSTKITRIVFMPHNDDNNVVFNDDYILSFWKNRWIPIKQVKAKKDHSVTFTDVPKNALLLLKNAKGGKEQRIFRYVNNRQEFW